jgi:hypothetical protein
VRSYNLKVAVRRVEMQVSVDHGLTGTGHPHLFLRSSASEASDRPLIGPGPIRFSAPVPTSLASDSRSCWTDGICTGEWPRNAGLGASVDAPAWWSFAM